jgi:hypothetical protein
MSGVTFHDISASRAYDDGTVERVEFTNRAAAWWTGTYQGGRVKTRHDVRVKLSIDEENGEFTIEPNGRYHAWTDKEGLTAVEFKHGENWTDRHSLRSQGATAGDEHREIIAAAIAFTRAVLDADPDILRRAQIAWHRERLAHYNREAEDHDDAMRVAIALGETHRSAIAELERGYTASTIDTMTAPG